MSEQFKAGQKLSVIYLDADAQIIAINGITIEVIMEHGQMAAVPWAYVVYPDGDRQKWNLAQCQGVKLEKP